EVHELDRVGRTDAARLNRVTAGEALQHILVEDVVAPELGANGDPKFGEGHHRAVVLVGAASIAGFDDEARLDAAGSVSEDPPEGLHEERLAVVAVLAAPFLIAEEEEDLLFLALSGHGVAAGTLEAVELLMVAGKVLHEGLADPLGVRLRVEH